jgi:probable rRNA maturation factor
LSPRPQRQILVTIEEPFRGKATTAWVRKVIASAMTHALPQDQPAQVAVLVTDDQTVRRLNRDFRGVDEVTDVLSFSADYPGHWEGEDQPPQGRLQTPENFGDYADFPLPPGEAPALGEVVISYPQTQRQAIEQRPANDLAVDLAVERELALLLVHGVLHLVGHDHLDPVETAAMQEKERAALAPIFLSDQPAGQRFGKARA